MPEALCRADTSGLLVDGEVQPADIARAPDWRSEAATSSSVHDWANRERPRARLRSILHLVPPRPPHRRRNLHPACCPHDHLQRERKL